MTSGSSEGVKSDALHAPTGGSTRPGRQLANRGGENQRPLPEALWIAPAAEDGDPYLMPRVLALLEAKVNLDIRLVRTVLARHLLTASSGLETRYLLTELFAGIFGFIVFVTLASTAGGLSFGLIGLPLLALVAHLDRWWCGRARARAARVLGAAIPPNYTAAQGGFFKRLFSIMGDRQTWRDALWVILSFPAGAVGGAVAILAWLGLPALLAAPIYAWSIPGWIHANDIWISILAPFLAVPAAVAGAWLLHPTALAHARMTARLLGPRRSDVLEQRVQTLAETRAGAVDAAVSELQRVERDLHDGAQARLVALAMDLGMAEQRLAQADHATAMEHVAAARGQARAAMAELRELVRGIGPSILQDHGLDAALTALVTGRNPPVELHVELPETPAGPRETAAYFVVAEALANARKHAHASRIWV